MATGDPNAPEQHERAFGGTPRKTGGTLPASGGVGRRARARKRLPGEFAEFRLADGRSLGEVMGVEFFGPASGSGGGIPLSEGDRTQLREGNSPFPGIIRNSADRFAPPPDTAGGTFNRDGAAPAPAAMEIAPPDPWNPDVGPPPDVGYVPAPAAAPNLSDPSRRESTAGETAQKFVENIPAMFKRSAGGLIQAQAEADIPAVGMPGLMFSLDPRARKMITMGMNAAIDKTIEAVTGSVPDRTLGGLGAEIFNSATADLEANAPNIDPESLKGYGYDIASALVQMAPAVGASVATRNPNIGLTVLGAQVYGDRYGESRAAGRTRGQAQMDATFYALTEAIPERIPLGILMKQGTKFLPRITNTMAAEGVQEVFTEILQTGYDAGILDEEMTWGDAWDRIKRSGIIGLFVGGGRRRGRTRS